MLTGLFPTSHGAHWAEADDSRPTPSQPATPIQGTCETLSEILASSGYRTAAVVANAWLNQEMNFGQGFEVFDNRPGTPPAPYRQAAEITEAAIHWLAGPDERPFFLMLNYMDPHVPYNPPPPFNSRFRDGGDGRGPARSWGNQFWAETRSAVVGGQRPLAERTRGLLLDRYDQELAYLDSEVGRLLDWLRDHRLYDRTLIILTADHGEAFGEHLIVGHGLGLYEPEVAVPMIVKLPYQARTGVEDAGVQHTDILPTVLDVLSLASPPAVQGESMLAASEDRPLYVEEYVDPENVQHALAADAGGWIAEVH
jgi:arylsulfatase A-like enzyme